MKNIFLKETQYPSRVQLKVNDKLHLDDGITTIALKSNMYVYITSVIEASPREYDELIKQGLFFESSNGMINTLTRSTIKTPGSYKKIIGTNDLDLIKTGSPSLSADILRWIVNNQSRDYIEYKLIIKEYVDENDAFGYDVTRYELIIPKLDPIEEYKHSDDLIYSAREVQQIVNAAKSYGASGVFSDWFDNFKKR